MGEPSTDPITGVKLPPYPSDADRAVNNVLDHYSAQVLTARCLGRLSTREGGVPVWCRSSCGESYLIVWRVAHRI